ncbi:MAG: CvpA family protein [Clostridia bacterium]|nr:CvpA family protein [Clostridia bacterium]
MNWTDLLVIGIIGGFAILGFVNGFLLSAFRIVSFFIAAILAVKLYPLVSNVLLETPLFTNIKEAIVKGLQGPESAEIGNKGAAAAVDTLNVPGFLKPMLTEEVQKQMNNGKTQILEVVSAELAKVVIAIIGVVVLYILIRVGLIFVRFLLKSISELPVFKQVNKVGGVGFGALEGLFSVYIVFAFLMLFNSVPAFKGFFTAVDSSLLAKYFYENNFIVNWMF